MAGRFFSCPKKATFFVCPRMAVPSLLTQRRNQERVPLERSFRTSPPFRLCDQTSRSKGSSNSGRFFNGLRSARLELLRSKGNEEQRSRSKGTWFVAGVSCCVEFSCATVIVCVS